MEVKELIVLLKAEMHEDVDIFADRMSHIVDQIGRLEYEGLEALPVLLEGYQFSKKLYRDVQNTFERAIDSICNSSITHLSKLVIDQYQQEKTVNSTSIDTIIRLMKDCDYSHDFYYYREPSSNELLKMIFALFPALIEYDELIWDFIIILDRLDVLENEEYKDTFLQGFHAVLTQRTDLSQEDLEDIEEIIARINAVDQK